MSLRHRPAAAPSLADSPRRSSTLSGSVSEARHSIRSSTDALFLPRVAHGAEMGVPDDDDDDGESHWQSAPLGLALVPAVAGVFFHNGSAVLTDITLLVLAAIFLNWSVRLPWDWYRSAQAVRQQHGSKYHDASEIPLDQADSSSSSSNQDECRKSAAAAAASHELQVHELVALASCFVLPLVGTWLLHAIRAKLSRPSEGLVSNYNLTIFLLAAEVRPFAHLLKLVQARTLYLQRVVASSASPSAEDVLVNTGKIAELSTRLDELEAHVANKAADAHPSSSPPADQPDQPDQPDLASLVTQSSADIRKHIQPDIDALNRAVRRYEKRAAVSSFQTDSRLRELDAHIRDAHVLAASAAAAAAAQRSDSSLRRGLLSSLLGCAYAALVLPLRVFTALLAIPSRIASAARDALNPGPDPQVDRSGRSGSAKGKSPRYPSAGGQASSRASSSRDPSLNLQRDVQRGLKKPIPEHED